MQRICRLTCLWMLSSEELVSVLETPVMNTFSGERCVIVFCIASPTHMETDQEELENASEDSGIEKSHGGGRSGLVSFLSA